MTFGNHAGQYNSHLLDIKMSYFTSYEDNRVRSSVDPNEKPKEIISRKNKFQITRATV
jgi:hypothetical protein